MKATSLVWPLSFAWCVAAWTVQSTAHLVGYWGGQDTGMAHCLSGVRVEFLILWKLAKITKMSVFLYYVPAVCCTFFISKWSFYIGMVDILHVAVGVASVLPQNTCLLIPANFWYMVGSGSASCASAISPGLKCSMYINLCYFWLWNFGTCGYWGYTSLPSSYPIGSMCRFFCALLAWFPLCSQPELQHN